MTKISQILIYSLALLLACSQLAAERELRPYRLINSDKLFIDLVDGEYLTRLNGNVHFFYGDTEFFSDQAEIYEEQKIARMFGNVKVVDDSLTLYSDQAEYLRLTEQLILTGNVYIREDHDDGTVRIFESDKGQYLRVERKIYAFDNIRFYDERENVFGSCNYLDYDLEMGYGFITNNPSIIVVGDETLNITAEKIEFYRDFNRVSASFNVNTVYEDYLISSDFLLFFIDDEHAVFLGEPELKADMADAVAEKFYIDFEDRKITSATLENNSLVYFSTREGAEKNSTIESVMMELTFVDGKIKVIEAFENVISNYISEPKERDKLVNYAESDRLTVTINDESEIETIVFHGRVKGTYKFSDKMIDRSAGSSEFDTE